MADLSKEEILQAKKLIGGLPTNQREAILKKMVGLEAGQKKQVLSNVLANADAFQAQSFEQGQKIKPGDFFDSPSSAMRVAGKTLQREEASVAEPIMSFIREFKQGRGPAFGEEDDETLLGSLVSGAKRGREGSSRSRFDPDRQSELGDIFRELGVAEPLAATGGLVLSGFLPSSLMTAFVGRAATKKGAQKLAAKQAAKKAANKEGPEMFQEIFRNLEKADSATKNVGAEVIESLTNIPSDEILFAIDNPKILTRANARPEALGDLTQNVAKKTAQAVKKNPDLFQVPDDVFLNKASQMSAEFKTLQQEVTKNLVDTKRQVFKRRAEGIIPKKRLNQIVSLTMNEFGLSDAGKIKPVFRDNPVAKTLNDIKNKIAKDFPNRPLSLDEITDLQKEISNIAFKRSNEAGAIGRTLPEVQAATRKIYSRFRGQIRKTFSTEPELLKAYDDFAEFASLRDEVKTTLKSEKKLASMIRKLDRQSPEQLSEFKDLIAALPNGVDHIDDIDNILDLKENSLANRLPGITKRTPESIEKSLEPLFKKSFQQMGRVDKQTLQALEGAIGEKFTRNLVELQVARSFSKKTNFFRALAAGGIAGGTLGLGFGKGAALKGALAGFAATDPRIQAQILKKGPKAIEFLKKTGKAASPALDPMLRATPRRLLQEQSQ